MRIAFIGNHRPSHSTESHVAASMELLGHTVHRIQEDEVGWPDRIEACKDADVCWWTSTHDFAHRWDQAEAHAAVDTLNGMLPTVFHHLDLWHGLNRADRLRSEPWTRFRWVFTADGDHQEAWHQLGVNHRFMPPAVFGPECVKGTPRDEYRSDVAFIGSWQSYGHREWWGHRKAMLAHLRRRYGSRFACWPRPGEPAVRNQDLNDLLASASVVVGDSCLASTSRAYWSDRAPETAGRGGALVFPYIDGLAKQLRPEEHVRYFMPGDHAEMCRQIDWLLDNPSERQAMVERAMAEVKARHTYERRVETILATVFG